MKVLHYLLSAIKNIKKLIKTKPLLYTFLIVSQIICIIVITLVSCLVYNAYETEHEIKDEEKSFSLILANYPESDSEFITYDSSDEQEAKKENVEDTLLSGYYNESCYMKNIRPKLNELAEFLGDDLCYITFWGSVNSKSNALFFTSGIHSPKYEYESEQLKYFENSNKNILRLDPFEYEDVFGKVPVVGDKLNINGIQYTVEITEKNVAALNMPYASLQDGFLVNTIFIGTIDVCTAERNKEIANKLNELFGYDNDLTVPVMRDLQEQQNIYMTYIITAVIILMVLLNISRIYSYILAYRKKAFAVMSICGVSKFKIFIIYFIELIFTLIATYGIGTFIFNMFILPSLETLYPSIVKFTTANMYMVLFAIYILTSLIVMSITILTFIRKSSLDMKRSSE